MYTFSIVVIVSIYSSPAVQKELETLRQELLILELLSEVYSNEEHHEHIKLKRSQIELLEDALRKLYVVAAFHVLSLLAKKCNSRVDFPALDGELKNLRQELNVLELFSEVHSGKDQHKRIDGKRSQIGQLEEVLEELYVAAVFHSCLHRLKLK